jgi:hypothetical protein
MGSKKESRGAIPVGQRRSDQGDSKAGIRDGDPLEVSPLLHNAEWFGVGACDRSPRECDGRFEWDRFGVRIGSEENRDPVNMDFGILDTLVFGRRGVLEMR